MIWVKLEKKRADSEFTLDAYSKKIIEFYNSVLSQG